MLPGSREEENISINQSINKIVKELNYIYIFSFVSDPRDPYHSKKKREDREKKERKKKLDPSLLK